jgi:hypothetical protein
VAVKLHGQAALLYMSPGDIALRFIAEHIASVAAGTASKMVSDGMMPSSRGMNIMSTDATAQQPESESEDDEVAAVASELRKSGATSNAVNNVVHLTSKTFYLATTDRTAGPLMVLFYVIFDGRSEVTLSLFSEAAIDLEPGNMAAINCYDWTDVCQRANISSYPTIRIYHSSDQPPAEYSGFLSKSAFVSTIKLWMQPTVLKVENSLELEQFVLGKLPRDLSTVPRVFAAFKTLDEPGVAVFTAAAGRQRGHVLFALATGQLAHTGCLRFGSEPPCIVVIRNSDAIHPFTVLPPLEGSRLSPGVSSVVVESLVNTISRATLLTLPELTAENFASYYALGRPFVIAFINTE